MGYDEIISHPRDGDDFVLEKHLTEVTARMLRIGRFEDEKRCSERTVASIIGWLHDFGKVTPAFQAKVRGEYYGRPQLTYHARLGAFAAYWVIDELGGEEREALAAFATISRHHGVLPDLATHVIEDIYYNEVNSGESAKAWAVTQVETIDEKPSHAQAANEFLIEAGSERTTWDRFRTAIRDGSLLESIASAVSHDSGFGPNRDPDPDLFPDTTYDRAIRYFGALTLADKTSAGEIPESNLRREPLPLETLDSYVEDLTADDELEQALNERREAAREDARTNGVRRLLASDADVGRLTLPTGLGKTFTGLTTAFTLRDEHYERRNLAEKPTVVYALPFTSIIEQTRELFEDPDLWNADPQSHKFTVHHHLSDTVTQVDTERGTNGDAETDRRSRHDALLGESWRSGTVLTTFVQLFESLAGPTNSASLKLSALQDAVIVLDEPQALPKRWWAAIPRLVRTLSDEFDATIIAMTATQPALFEASNDCETVELLEDAEEYYREAKRVQYTVDDSVWALGNSATETVPVSHKVAGGRIVDAVTAGQRSQDTAPAPSALAVCNTIASSRRLTDTVLEAASSDVIHVGEVYEQVLEDAGAREPADDDDPSERFTDPDTLARRTLERLGLTAGGKVMHPESESITDVQWVWDEQVQPSLIVATFNSRYRPRDRRVLVRLADVLTTIETPFVLVSTQAVEAGVDLSFGQVFRDVAPLDSIVQAAGRCNRSFQWGIEGGAVTIWLLADPDAPDAGVDQTPAAHVYEGEVGEHLSLIAETLREELPSNTEIDELHMTRQAVPAYFDAIQKQSIASQQLRSYVDDFEATMLGATSLIQQDYPTVDVLVAVTDTERELLEKLGDAFANGDTPTAYDLLQSAADLRLSVPARDAAEALTGVPRADRKDRGEPEGVHVLAFDADRDGGGSYDLDSGGFIADDDDAVGGRFTI
ncbi:CRISPR-associated endonuclease Cas3'' [Natrinema altunense]|uniref:CRISPR-associated endonuclease Cas3 n=1 Tax=Natrinema altunense TaxID=222984 RepID=A0A482Y3N3_9EURY|nr:CRISPR-associated endonuclease Cas3'' [Natrinema altunense]RZH69013.1 CRISPR-associated endonuclease Cas3'' [Natrinema altunense]